jgi:hypothetical protein
MGDPKVIPRLKIGTHRNNGARILVGARCNVSPRKRRTERGMQGPAPQGTGQRNAADGIFTKPSSLRNLLMMIYLGLSEFNNKS